MSISNDGMPKQTPSMDDWRRSIGSFILNFGHLEYLTNLYLKDNLAPEEYARFAKSLFKQRVERIEKHVHECDRSEAKRGEIAALFKRLEPLRNLRNHVAHGYMCWNFAEQDGESWVSLVMPGNIDQERSPETRHLKFDDLSASLKELDEVIAGFDSLVGFKP